MIALSYIMNKPRVIGMALSIVLSGGMAGPALGSDTGSGFSVIDNPAVAIGPVASDTMTSVSVVYDSVTSDIVSDIPEIPAPEPLPADGYAESLVVKAYPDVPFPEDIPLPGEGAFTGESGRVIPNSINDGSARVPTDPGRGYDYYKGKSRRLKRAAWITLGAGAFVAGGGTLAGCLSAGSDAAVVVWTTTWLTGGLSMLASLPLFITSAHYMNLANRTLEYTFNIDPIKVTDLAGNNHNVPAIGVTIRF